VAARRRSRPRRAVVSKEFHSCLLCLVGAPARRRAVCCSRSPHVGVLVCLCRTSHQRQVQDDLEAMPVAFTGTERERRSQMSCGGSKRRLPPLRPQNSCCSWSLGCGQLDQDCSRGLHACWARIASVRLGCEVFRSAMIGWTNARFDCDTSKTTAGCLLGSRSICLGTPMAICFHADQPMYWSIYSAWRW